MLRVESLLAIVVAVACIGLTAAGCGGSSSSSDGGGSGSVATDGEPGQTAGAPSEQTTITNVGGGASKGTGGESAEGGGSSQSSVPGKRSGSVGNGTEASGKGGSPGAHAGRFGGKRNENGAPLGADTANSGDNSIQTYGSAASGAEEEAVASAWRSFVLAIANRDFSAVCSGLSERIRQGLATGEACPSLLEKLVVISPAEARDDANGTVTQVRVGGGNAFVLFHPSGSSVLNYFAMASEGGRWKSLGLTIGEPINLSAVPGQ